MGMGVALFIAHPGLLAAQERCYSLPWSPKISLSSRSGVCGALRVAIRPTRQARCLAKAPERGATLSVDGQCI